jgi:ParB family chromosome partitioning protein
LIPAEDPEALAEEVVRRGLSVRDTEKLVRSSKGQSPAMTRGGGLGVNADIEALERQLGDMLGLKVRISHKLDGGSVALSYTSLDQLDMICQRLSGERI